MEELIPILLTTPEAILFRDFQQFHKTFALLTKSGVFDIKNGIAILHFDSDGNVQKIEREDTLFNGRSLHA